MEKYIMPTVKYSGGSLIFWVCFSSRGPGHLVWIHGIMDSQILNEHLTASARKLKMGRNWTMIQNIHQNQHKNGLLTTKIKVLPWPSQFPDWNPIEKLWGELKRGVHQHGPRNGKDLKRFCIEEWPQFPYPCILHTHQSGEDSVRLSWQREAAQSID